MTVRLRVTDPGRLSGTTTETITIGAPPTVSITVPTTPWAVGDTINFSATASVPASRLTWSLLLRHCSRTDASVCHTHAIQDYVGVASGSFVAPDHEYPSHLELSVTATDTAGLTTKQSATLMPRTADLTVASEPAGLEISLGSESLLTPFTRTVLARSANQVSTAAVAAVRGCGVDVRELERGVRERGGDRPAVGRRDRDRALHAPGADEPRRRGDRRHARGDGASRAAARSTR